MAWKEYIHRIQDSLGIVETIAAFRGSQGMQWLLNIFKRKNATQLELRANLFFIINIIVMRCVRCERR